MPILEDGQLFERYRVHRWLGSGIAGESYEAEDRILQRKVTLKLIHPWTTLSDSARRQFFREMQGISLLNHPYLATVLDYGETDGRIYVARRYVSSGSLLGTNGRLWFPPPLPVTDAFKYAHQLAQALQYIHQHGYLHGSLTFANVLVLRGPNTENDADYAPFLVADVGLANFVRRFGNPRIETLPISAAPEQLGKRVTPASDQFALAALLYFWLAGRPPYLGTSNEIEYQKLSETITPLSILNPGITLEQESIILRALTVYPEDRHASVLAFTDTLLASLASATRQYAIPPDTFAPLTEAQPERSQKQQDETPVTTSAEVQAAPVDQLPSTPAPAPAAGLSAPAQPVQARTEPYLSALEQLLSHQQSSSESVAPSVAPPAEQSRAVSEQGEGQTETTQEELFLFPRLPETPRVEETILQNELAQVVREGPVMPPGSKQTGPLSLAPASDVQENQADEPAEAIRAELPGSADLTSPDEPLPVPAKTVPTAPLEELSAATYENAPVLLSNGFSPTHEEVVPTSLPDEPASTNAETTPAPAQQTTTAANESTPPVHTASQSSAELSSQVESLVAGEEVAPVQTESTEKQEPELEVAPTVPLQESTSATEEASSSAESVSSSPESTPASTQFKPAPRQEEASIPAELAMDTSANPTLPAFPAETVRELDLSPPPLQDTHETDSATYPLLDEAIVAPRLIISSPYTSSSFEFLLTGEETNIGRAGSSDLYLEQDNLTSRHHALLKRVGERVLIFDKRSHNGVFLNGQKLEVARGYELADGDHIGIGNYELIFRSASSGHLAQLI